MTTISLRDYVKHISTLIEHGNHSEAVFHCTNILKSYPKCVDIYRLLGRSLLKNGKHAEALDVFSKVLSVIPDDSTAHAGLSEVYENKQQLDKAIWHMERSFEAQPSNLHAQEELKRLFSLRDGIPPTKIRLTRGALIRMYAKGELYQQAIAEAQSVLDGDNEREDVRLLLAKMYQSSGAIVEAADTCSGILENFPYCYEANNIMHDIELSRGETGDSSLFTARMTEIDPYFGLVNEDHPSTLDVPSDSIILDKPEFDEGETEEEIPEWARQIGLSWPASSPPPSSEDTELAGGMTTIEDIEAEIIENSELREPFLDIPEEQMPEPQESPDDELPDWIAKAGWIRATEDETPPTIEEIPTIEPNPDVGEQAAPAEELPDWLKSLTPVPPLSDEMNEVDGGMPNFNEDDLEEISSISVEEINDILGKDNLGNIEVEADRSVIEEILSEGSTADDIVVVGDLPENASAEIPDLPDWLRDLEISESMPEVPEETASEWIPVVEDVTTKVSDISGDSIIPLADEESVEIESINEPLIPESGFLEETPLPTEKSLDELMEELSQKLPPPLEQAATMQKVPAVTEGKTTKPVVPSWVQKILGTSEIVAPVAAATNVDLTPSDEDIEPLITDLPGEPPKEGAISDDVNLELMTWLTDINPDDALEQNQVDAAIGQVENIIDQVDRATIVVEAAEEVESTEITFDALSDPTLITENETSQEFSTSSEVEQQPVFEESTTIEFNDRLSSLLDQDKLTSANEISAVEITTPPSKIPISEETTPAPVSETIVIADDSLLQLLNEKKYKEFNERLSKKPVAEELLQKVNDRALSIAKDEPDSFELWKSIGDIGLKKTDIKQAIEAYKNAERLLFQ